MAQQETKDHWTNQTYSTAAPYVPLLASKVTDWLNPQSSDVILDLGCGHGTLSAEIKQRCSSVTGFDASKNLIEAAQKAYPTVPGLTWHLEDCRYLEHSTKLEAGAYTKVFSNAALHWILRDSTTRLSVLRGALKALKPGGQFVFEMGGAGNVAEVHSVLLAALIHRGISVEAARDASPWFFPSEQLMRSLLTQAGFKIEKSELEYRPTQLPSAEKGGLDGWVRLFGAPFLEVLQTDVERDAVVREICDVLNPVVSHEEDDSMWLGYVRLRVLAVRPEEQKNA